MKWQEVRESFPRQWVLMEAIYPHSDNGYCIYETLAVADRFTDGTAAWDGYAKIRKSFPQREWLVLHTDNPSLIEDEVIKLQERNWLGIRAQYED